MEDVIEQFYSREYEKKINKEMLSYSYEFPRKEILDYVERVLAEPIDKFIEYIEKCEKSVILAKDVFQFSDIEDATINYCMKMSEKDNPGMKYLEIGKMLLDDEKERKDGAYIKYGENHAKTAKMLGLSYEICGTYFLSCIGIVFLELNNTAKQELMVRLILRNKLIIRLWQATQNGKVNVREFLYMLADATYVRRRSNVKKIIKYLNITNNAEIDNFIDSLIFN